MKIPAPIFLPSTPGANRPHVQPGNALPMHLSDKSDYDLISELAFRIYEQEGRPEGMAEDHWRRAERALEQLRLSEPPGQKGGNEGR